MCDQGKMSRAIIYTTPFLLPKDTVTEACSIYNKCVEGDASPSIRIAKCPRALLTCYSSINEGKEHAQLVPGVGWVYQALLFLMQRLYNFIADYEDLRFAVEWISCLECPVTASFSQMPSFIFDSTFTQLPFKEMQTVTINAIYEKNLRMVGECGVSVVQSARNLQGTISNNMRYD
jgi:hypothetical protein